MRDVFTFSPLVCRWLVKYDWVKRIKTSPDYHTTTTTTGSPPATFPFFKNLNDCWKKGSLIMYQNVSKGSFLPKISRNDVFFSATPDSWAWKCLHSFCCVSRKVWSQMARTIFWVCDKIFRNDFASFLKRGKL